MWIDTDLFEKKNVIWKHIFVSRNHYTKQTEFYLPICVYIKYS